MRLAEINSNETLPQGSRIDNVTDPGKFMRYLLFVLCSTVVLSAQTKSIKATRLTEPIAIDGVLTDWGQAPVMTGFTESNPEPLTKPDYQTFVQFSHDRENAYFLVKVQIKPDDIVTQSGRRDNAFWNGDYVIIYIDPLHDKQSGFRFGVNPSNVQHDALIYNDNSSDDRWDAVWYSETRIVNDGWVAEFAIPFRAISVQDQPTQNWGVNVQRYNTKINETSWMIALNPDLGPRVSTFGEITGIREIQSGNYITFKPSITANANYRNDPEPITAFTKSQRVIGGDLGYNIDGQNQVTLTVIPDFSQIEIDQDQINITDFPTRLQEKRPFFLEGISELYNFRDEIFRTRRMNSPDAGLKFIGKQGKLQYGLLAVHNKQRLGPTNFSYENFIYPRLKYVDGNRFSAGYMLGHMASTVQPSLNLHAIDMSYRPTDQISTYGILSTTALQSVGDSNYSAGIQASWSNDLWSVSGRFQVKTPHYQQEILGEFEYNNITERGLTVNRNWRINQGTLRSVNANVDWFGQGLGDGSHNRYSIRYNVGVNYQFPEMGAFNFGVGGSYNSGYFRQPFFDSAEADDFRNQGYPVYLQEDGNTFNFYMVDETNRDFWFNMSTDGSKIISANIFMLRFMLKFAEVYNFQYGLSYRPNSNLQFTASYTYFDIYKPSDFIPAALYRDFSLRSDIALANNLVLKHFIQYNTQSQFLANNLVLTYEYERGSFLYFAMVERGQIIDGFEGGNIIPSYKLNINQGGDRVFSLKITKSFFL